jgi:hypothetical protein
MPERACRYPRSDVPFDAASTAAREVTVTIDPEDAISILRALREACCPQALRAVAEAITDGGNRG